jgi:hypothetical protein
MAVKRQSNANMPPRRNIIDLTCHSRYFSKNPQQIILTPEPGNVAKKTKT